MTYCHDTLAYCSKTQKILAKRWALGARGLNQKRFCNGLVVRGIGGNALFQYLQHVFCDISLLISTSNRQVSHF